MADSGDRAQRRRRLLERLARMEPDLTVTDVQIDNYLDAQERLGGATHRLDEIGEIEVREVTPEIVDDVLDFFDHDAFADNPGWASCYCAFHHVGENADPPWEQRTWRYNRDELARRIQTGETTAFLAYVDGRPAGWLNASARATFPDHATGDDDGVASLVCFVVAPPYRGHGISRRLLQEALTCLGGRGFRVAEAYPVQDPADDAAAYHGPPSLLAAAGFEAVGGEPDRPVVRRDFDVN
jgi:GNAT superfamily N-acetyltransferase